MVQARWAGKLPLFGAPAAGAPIPYTPACHSGPLPVCVHPAYRAQLGETAALLNRIAAPVHGAPGAPTRAVQRPGTVGVVSGGTHWVQEAASLAALRAQLTIWVTAPWPHR